jgi:hypothetical protein
MAESTEGHHPMTQDLWIHAYPAQADEFLQLHYQNQYNQPEGATTSIYRHPWSDHDYMGLAAEMEITRAGDDGYRVRLIAYSWDVWQPYGTTTKFERYKGCTVSVWDTHETFGNFYDAEAFALFAWARWRATGRGGSAGMLLRDDLDNLLNPIPLVAAVGC